MKAYRGAPGYTLVELAIVLAIITLLLGGIVMGGSALMDSARTSSVMAQIGELSVAARTFKTRYGYPPGDLPNAGNYLPNVSQGCNVKIGSSSTIGNGLTDDTERSCALEDLANAGLITGADNSSGLYTMPHPFGGGDISLGSTPSNLNAVSITNLPCRIALQINGKLDNESNTPLSDGNVLGLDASGSLMTQCTPGSSNDPVPTLLIRY